MSQLIGELSAFVCALSGNGRSKHTIAQYERHIGLLLRWISDANLPLEVDELQPPLLARFLASDAACLRPDGTPKKASAMNCLRSSVRAFGRYLYESGRVTQNPARMIRLARCEPAPPRGFTPREMERLRSVLDSSVEKHAEEDRVLFEFLLATGLRIGAALALQVEDLDLERGLAWLRNGKGGQSRSLVLSEGARAHLNPWLMDRYHGPVFDVSVRTAQRRFAGWVQRAGLPRAYTLHSCRHTFAMRLYERTGDLLLVQQALHHRSVASTLVYARCTDDRLRAALNA